MAKKAVVSQIKVQVPGGQATPAPPVGTALGPHGVNIGQFVQQFNERTREMAGTTVPVVITVYNDRTFEIITKRPPAAVLLKQATQIANGASKRRTDKVARVTADQMMQIAWTEFGDLSAYKSDHACRTSARRAPSMGMHIAY